MALLQCPSGPQDTNWCPKTTDEAFPSVLGLLPPGPAWEGAAVDGTFQNQYWRSFSSVIGFTYGRLCAYVDEFFCATVNESRDQWAAEFNLDDPCDPYGYNLCVKVAAQGGATCEYFVSAARQSGWVIDCDPVDIAEPIAGCFEVGCTGLGPTPVYVQWGNPLGYGEQGACSFGEVVQHPDPTVWEYGAKQAGPHCPIPGSNLGHGPDTDESCCFIVGYYDFHIDSTPPDPDYCTRPVDTITFDCPREGIVNNPIPALVMSKSGVFDSSGSYSEYGHAYLWQVTVKMAESFALQGASLLATDDPNPTTSAAGCFSVGDTPLCSNEAAADFVLCFLERIKPAHTKLLTKVLP